jgi:hypothetical protein
MFYRRGLVVVLLAALSATPARAQFFQPVPSPVAPPSSDFFGIGDLLTSGGLSPNDSQPRHEPPLLTPSEEIQERQRQLELRHALNDPPATEIDSGDVLNSLLKTIQSMQTHGVTGPVVPLDAETLRHIHLSGTGGGNPAALQTQKISWPLVMRDTPYDADRARFQELTDTALKQLTSDNLQLSTVRELEATVDHMEATLNARARDESLPDVIDVQKQLETLRDGIAALKSPGAANYLDTRWAAQGRDVNELVSNMTRENLRFAAASAGDEGCYQVLYRLMAAYVSGASQV